MSGDRDGFEAKIRALLGQAPEKPAVPRELPSIKDFPSLKAVMFSKDYSWEERKAAVRKLSNDELLGLIKTAESPQPLDVLRILELLRSDSARKEDFWKKVSPSFQGGGEKEREEKSVLTFASFSRENCPGDLYVKCVLHFVPPKPKAGFLKTNLREADRERCFDWASVLFSYGRAVSPRSAGVFKFNSRAGFEGAAACIRRF